MGRNCAVRPFMGSDSISHAAAGTSKALVHSLQVQNPLHISQHR